MPLDFGLIASISEKVLVLAAGAAIGRVFERRTRLSVFYGHIGYFKMQPGEPGGQMGIVHTHTMILRNNGRLPARNVRVPHKLNLKSRNVHVSVNPDTPYTMAELPGGGEELVFPILAWKQGVAISYLYFPPVNAGDINGAVFSDDGPARYLDALPTPQLPKWQRIVAWSLFGVGAITVLYGLSEAMIWLSSKTGWLSK